MQLLPIRLPSQASASRYGEGRRMNPAALLLVLALHAALAAAIFHSRAVYLRKKEAALALVNLMPPPAPPPPNAEQRPPEPLKTPIVAPPPRVQLPSPAAPPILAAPDPSPSAPTPVPPAPPAPPVPPSIVTSHDLSARMVSGKPPRYPMESRRKREQGTVVLALIVGTDGKVESISISRSSGFSRLDDAALGAVRGWRWQPLLRDSQPVRIRGLVQIPFVIAAGSGD